MSTYNKKLDLPSGINTKIENNLEIKDNKTDLTEKYAKILKSPHYGFFEKSGSSNLNPNSRNLREMEEKYGSPEIIVATRGEDVVYLIGTMHVSITDYAAELRGQLMGKVYREIDCVALESTVVADMGVNPKAYALNLGHGSFHKMDTEIFHEACEYAPKIKYGYSLDTDKSFSEANSAINEAKNDVSGNSEKESKPAVNQLLQKELVDKRNKFFAERITAPENSGKKQLVLMGKDHVSGVLDILKSEGFEIKPMDLYDIPKPNI